MILLDFSRLVLLSFMISLRPVVKVITVSGVSSTHSIRSEFNQNHTTIDFRNLNHFVHNPFIMRKNTTNSILQDLVPYVNHFPYILYNNNTFFKKKQVCTSISLMQTQHLPIILLIIVSN